MASLSHIPRPRQEWALGGEQIIRGIEFRQERMIWFGFGLNDKLREKNICSLRSTRLEVVGARKNESVTWLRLMFSLTLRRLQGKKLWTFKNMRRQFTRLHIA